jgi:hypothetical protein
MAPTAPPRPPLLNKQIGVHDRRFLPAGAAGDGTPIKPSLSPFFAAVIGSSRAVSLDKMPTGHDR